MQPLLSATMDTTSTHRPASLSNETGDHDGITLAKTSESQPSYSIAGRIMSILRELRRAVNRQKYVLDVCDSKKVGGVGQWYLRWRLGLGTVGLVGAGTYLFQNQALENLALDPEYVNSLKREGSVRSFSRNSIKSSLYPSRTNPWPYHLLFQTLTSVSCRKNMRSSSYKRQCSGGST